MYLRAALAIAVAIAILSTERAVDSQTTQFFTTGQSADQLLSGYGFNRTGGSLRFNHPAGVVVINGNLVLADRNNNRVLLWSGIPSSGTVAPSIVLGQSTFDTNAPGTGLDGLNWPTALATDGTRLYVADAYNHRVLVWLTLPTANKQAADFALTRSSGPFWPWGIWTNGQKLVVSATEAARVFVWNSQPSSDVAPDLELQMSDFGTPRTVESDGTHLLVSDHNARNNNSSPGTFFFNTFPTSPTQTYSFFLPRTPISGVNATNNEHMHDAEALSDGRLIGIFNRTICLWAAFPTSTTDYCATALTNTGNLVMDLGDNSGVAVSSGRMFVSMNNGDRVLVYNTIPTSAIQLPDYAVGSPDIYTNTLDTDFIITNPVPYSDGTRLLVSSDYDRRMHVWRALPSRDAQPPDYTYSFNFGPWASARVGDGFVLVGQRTILMWNSLPTGQAADTTITNTIGTVTLQDLRGVAYDGTYFALSDYQSNRVWVWRGIPSASTAPIAEITVIQPGRIALDGRYLGVPSVGTGHALRMYSLSQLEAGTIAPVTVGTSIGLGLPETVVFASNAMFVPDTVNNRVLIWQDAAAAFAGQNPEIVLGTTSLTPERRPAIGQNTLFWPAAVSYDGNRLWVGEFKFSNRLVRFTRPGSNALPTISDIANASINEDAQLSAVAFTVSDTETAANALTVAAESSNTTLVPNSGIVLGGSGGSRTISVTPAANRSGTATILVTVNDGSSTVSDSFTLTVNGVNDAPTLSAVAAQTGTAGRLVGPLTVTVADSDTDLSTLTLTGTSSNTAIVANGGITTSGTTASRTVNVQTASASGSTIITLTVSDGSASASTTFDVVSTHSSPQSFTATADGSLVSFAWTAPASTGAISTYRVAIGSSAGATSVTLDTTTTSLIATTLTTGTWHARVTAIDSMGTSPASNEVSFVLTGTPSSPRSLTANVAGNTLTLTWEAPVAGTATSYELSAGTATGLSNLAVVPVGPARSLTASAPNGTYYVRVKARNAVGLSNASNEVNFSVGPALPGAPQNFAASASGSTVTMTWSPPVGGGSVTSYVLEAGSASGLANLASVPVGGTSLTATGVPSGTYYLRVRGRNQLGMGAASNEAIVSVGSGSLAPPGAPSGLVANVSGSTVTLSWLASTSGGAPTNYTIHAGSATGLSNIAMAAVGVTTTFSASGVPRGTYYLRIVATNAAGTSPASNEVRVVVP